MCLPSFRSCHRRLVVTGWPLLGPTAALRGGEGVREAGGGRALPRSAQPKTWPSGWLSLFLLFTTFPGGGLGKHFRVRTHPGDGRTHGQEHTPTRPTVKEEAAGSNLWWHFSPGGRGPYLVGPNSFPASSVTFSGTQEQWSHLPGSLQCQGWGSEVSALSHFLSFLHKVFNIVIQRRYAFCTTLRPCPCNRGHAKVSTVTPNVLIVWAWGIAGTSPPNTVPVSAGRMCSFTDQL